MYFHHEYLLWVYMVYIYSVSINRYDYYRDRWGANLDPHANERKTDRLWRLVPRRLSIVVGVGVDHATLFHSLGH